MVGRVREYLCQGFQKQEPENANITATGCGALTRGPALDWALVHIISHNWCSKWQPSELLCHPCARDERIEARETELPVQGDVDGGGEATTKAGLSLKSWVCPHLLWSPGSATIMVYTGVSFGVSIVISTVDLVSRTAVTTCHKLGA